jgi:phosphatidylglycerophosphatase A
MYYDNMKRFLLLSATLFGVGRLKVGNLKPMPGTWGTLVSLPLCALFLSFGPIVYMVLTLMLIIYAIFAAQAYENSFDGHDRSEVVIDEFAGILVTMTWLPMTWQTFVAAFIVFRFLDILKPFPISYFDKNVKGGFGVVVDDLVAGIIGNIILQVVLNKTSWLGVQIG